MINLLTYKESFLWEDTTLNRSQFIRKLNDAILISKQYGDSHFKTEDFNLLVVSWGNLMEFVFNYGYDESQRLSKFPWMSQIEHTTLIQILSTFKNTTIQNSNDLLQMDAEYGQNKNAFIGFEINEEIDKYVSCIISLDHVHNNYASNLNRQERLANSKYFINHYTKHSLKVESSSINNLIARRQTHHLFKRLDSPKTDRNGSILHGESFHMHFKDKNNSCLGIGGDWKHGGFDIPNDVCEILVEWGFVLPENLI